MMDEGFVGLSSLQLDVHGDIDSGCENEDVLTYPYGGEQPAALPSAAVITKHTIM